MLTKRADGKWVKGGGKRGGEGRAPFASYSRSRLSTTKKQERKGGEETSVIFMRQGGEKKAER